MSEASEAYSDPDPGLGFDSDLDADPYFSFKEDENGTAEVEAEEDVDARVSMCVDRVCACVQVCVCDQQYQHLGTEGEEDGRVGNIHAEGSGVAVRHPTPDLTLISTGEAEPQLQLQPQQHQQQRPRPRYQYRTEYFIQSRADTAQVGKQGRASDAQGMDDIRKAAAAPPPLPLFCFPTVAPKDDDQAQTGL